MTSRAHLTLIGLVKDELGSSAAAVLTNPELILGDQAVRVLKFWEHLDALTPLEWKSARAAAWRRENEWAALTSSAAEIAQEAAVRIAGESARFFAFEAVCSATGDTEREASWATYEIMGASKLGMFRFLPAFGFANPDALDALPDWR